MDSLQRLFEVHCEPASGLIVREEEWHGLVSSLRDGGLVVEPHEIHFLNSLWTAQVSQAEWHHGETTKSQQTLASLKAIYSLLLTCVCVSVFSLSCFI
jgi:hypothetical protein